MTRLIGTLGTFFSVEEYVKLIQKGYRVALQAYAAAEATEYLVKEIIRQSRETDHDSKMTETKEKIIKIEKFHLYSKALFVVGTTGDLWFSELSELQLGFLT